MKNNNWKSKNIKYCKIFQKNILSKNPQQVAIFYYNIFNFKN